MYVDIYLWLNGKVVRKINEKNQKVHGLLPSTGISKRNMFFYLFELARLSVFEPEHVEDADEAVSGVADRVVQDGHRLARLPGSGRADRRRVLARHLELIV
jgi:hypothetical protein